MRSLSSTSSDNANDAPDTLAADLFMLICAEYEEMPGLNLTLPQVCRLFDIDPETGEAVLRKLVNAGVLVRSASGGYTRRGFMM